MKMGELEVIVHQETDSAWLVIEGDKKTWLPKSLTQMETDFKGWTPKKGVVLIPEWLAIKKGLV